MTKDDVMALLESCQSAADWEAACETIKEAHNWSYPTYWWEDVKKSGLMDRIMARWGTSSEIRIVSDPEELRRLFGISSSEGEYGTK